MIAACPRDADPWGLRGSKQTMQGNEKQTVSQHTHLSAEEPFILIVEYFLGDIKYCELHSQSGDNRSQALLSVGEGGVVLCFLRFAGFFDA